MANLDAVGLFLLMVFLCAVAAAAPLGLEEAAAAVAAAVAAVAAGDFLWDTAPNGSVCFLITVVALVAVLAGGEEEASELCGAMGEVAAVGGTRLAVEGAATATIAHLGPEQALGVDVHLGEVGLSVGLSMGSFQLVLVVD